MINKISVINLIDVFNGGIYYDGDYTLELMNDYELLLTNHKTNKTQVYDCVSL